LTLSVGREKVNNRKLLCKKSIDSCPVEPPLRTGADIFARSAAAAAAEAVADREIVFQCPIGHTVGSLIISQIFIKRRNRMVRLLHTPLILVEVLGCCGRFRLLTTQKIN
jgi:hypothetical protein